MKLKILFFLLLISSLTYAQKVSVTTDTTNIRIGEQFLFKIVIKDTANVIFPEKLENLTSLEVVKDVKIDTFKNSLIKKYLMTGFDSGAFYIPTQQIFIKNRAYLSDSVLINVATVAVDTTKQKMFPIKAIQTEPLVYDDFKPYIIWVVLAILLIGLFIYYLKNRKKPEIKEAIEKAFKVKVLKVNTLISNRGIKKAYVLLSAETPAIDVATQLGLM